MSLVKRQNGHARKKKDKTANVLPFIIGGMFMSFVLLFFCLLILPAIRDLQSNPVRVPGTVVSSSVRTSRGSKGGVTYRPAISFTYSYENRTYGNDRVGILNYGSGDSRRAYDLVDRFPEGASVEVLVNPARPDKGFLDTGESFWKTCWIPILFLSVFFLAGLAITGVGIRNLLPSRKKSHATQPFAGLPMESPKPFPRRRFSGKLIGPVVATAIHSIIGGLLFAVGRDELIRTRGRTPLSIFVVFSAFFFILLVVVIVRLVVQELGSRHFRVSGRAAFFDHGGLAEVTYACEAEGTIASEITVHLVGRRLIGRKTGENKRTYRQEDVVDKILAQHSNSPAAAPRALSIEAPDPDLTPEGIPLEDDPDIVSVGPAHWFLVINATFPDSKIKTSDEFKLD